MGFIKKYKSIFPALAIIFGIIFYKWIYVFIDLVPYLIFSILVFAYSALNFRRLKITKFNLLIVFLHIALSVVVYILCYRIFKPVVAQSVLVGMICPIAAASSAVVVALGGNREVSVANTLLDNMVIAFVAPLMFSFAETAADMSFLQSVLLLFKKITPIVVLPLVIIILLRRLLPKIAHKVAFYEWLSIPCWSVSLMINIAAATFSVVQMRKEFMFEIIIMLILSLIMCVFQFAFGRYVGGKFSYKIAGAQALGQKNIGLGIWMAYTYFSNPLTTLYAAGYSVWQNVFNSAQMYIHDKKQKQ